MVIRHKRMVYMLGEKEKAKNLEEREGCELLVQLMLVLGYGVETLIHSYYPIVYLAPCRVP